MPKLQRITRPNGSHVYSVNIPLEIIDEIKWEKGDELEVSIHVKDQQVKAIEVIKVREEQDG